jgi:hypothetical protein
MVLLVRELKSKNRNKSKKSTCTDITNRCSERETIYVRLGEKEREEEERDKSAQVHRKVPEDKHVEMRQIKTEKLELATEIERGET